MQRQRAPAEPGTGANFVTFRLKHEGTLWRYRPTFMAQIFQRIFSLGGYVAAVIGLTRMAENLLAGLAAITIGALFVWIGRYLSARFGTGASFDTLSRRMEVYENLGQIFTLSPTAQTRHVHFDSIHQIEVLTKMVHSSEHRDYENTELNLVLHDGERINLVSHPDGQAISREASTLAEVLHVPIKDYRPGKTT